jgi:ubiquinone/menaquinone biosynthesis C-methylase UbiE
MSSYQHEDEQRAAEQLSGTVRLFNPDLPEIKKTGNIFPEQSDLSAVRDVLDVACGDGAWALQVAQAYPHMRVVGIDGSSQMIDDARARAAQSGLDNVRFVVMDPFQPLDLADGGFDLVNVRFIAGFTPLALWSGLVAECLRVLRPGGIIRLTEGDIPISNSPAFERMNDMVSRALQRTKQHLYPPSLTGQNLLITPLLGRLLRDAQCLDIQKSPRSTNFSAGTEIHVEVCQDIARTYRLMQPLLTQMELMTQEELDLAYQQMLSEMQTGDFCAIQFYLIVWGRKP